MMPILRRTRDEEMGDIDTDALSRDGQRSRRPKPRLRRCALEECKTCAQSPG